ncbi:hypothetical protein C8034_v003990 [Colletotrichum sidae]|uniref:G domain-containing protein n=1 Tax=Colletotrichum sidae TaxID=1347389 RepID=A0A4R8T8Z8_9PEZI|nr:hypothetical protein C8034_v003990 [Colletotrichum sidae]
MSHKRSHAPRWWENRSHSDSDGERETVRTIASDEESLSDSEDREKGDEAAENSAEAPKGLGVPRETDIFIACMGVTGSGKSSFISGYCGQQVKVGHELNSCTSVVEVFPFELSPGQTVYLIDTPGFDDTERSDTDVLRAIAHWLNESYKNKVLLRGIIYFHRILDVRMQGSAKKNILMFKKLCGNDALRNVALVTSMWDKVPKPEAEARERQLVETPHMALRHDNTAASALAVARRLVDGGGPPVKLDVQDEMIDRRKLLDQTEAWQELEAEPEQQQQQQHRGDADEDAGAGADAVDDGAVTAGLGGFVSRTVGVRRDQHRTPKPRELLPLPRHALIGRLGRGPTTLDPAWTQPGSTSRWSGSGLSVSDFSKHSVSDSARLSGIWPSPSRDKSTGPSAEAVSSISRGIFTPVSAGSSTGASAGPPASQQSGTAAAWALGEHASPFEWE